MTPPDAVGVSLERVERVLADALCRASFGDFTTSDMERVARRQMVALRRAGMLDSKQIAGTGNRRVAP